MNFFRALFAPKTSFQALSEQVQQQVFPNGEVDHIAGQEAMLDITQHRLLPKQALEVFIHSAILFDLVSEKTLERLATSLTPKFPGMLNSSEIEALHTYLAFRKISLLFSNQAPKKDSHGIYYF